MKSSLALTMLASACLAVDLPSEDLDGRVPTLRYIQSQRLGYVTNDLFAAYDRGVRFDWWGPGDAPALAELTGTNRAAALLWEEARIDAVVANNRGSVAYSGSVAAGTWIEVPGETKTFAVRATDAGDLMTVPAAESPHKTPAEIVALFRAETNAVPSLGVMMQRAGVSIPEGRWYVTNTLSDSAMTTAQRNLSEKISRTVTRWQMLRAWREARQ